jgi:NTE family protein
MTLDAGCTEYLASHSQGRLANPDRALVLGGGGPVGTAWMAGLLLGLRRAGLDMGHADRIIGTSAGAIVGAALAVGRDLSGFAHLSEPSDPARHAARPDPARMQEVLAILGTPGLEPGEARRRAGRLALADRDPAQEQAQISGRHALIGTDSWPDRGLMIVAVDAASGEPVVWDRASGVPLVPAVTASSAFPGASPPIRIGERWYIDGALRSGTNTDLATGARLLVVIEPLAHLFRGQSPRREPRTGQAGTVVSVGPDAASVRAFGTDLYDSASWNPAYQAGLAQAATVADEIAVQWNGAA